MCRYTYVHNIIFVLYVAFNYIMLGNFYSAAKLWVMKNYLSLDFLEISGLSWDLDFDHSHNWDFDWVL